MTDSPSHRPPASAAAGRRRWAAALAWAGATLGLGRVAAMARPPAAPAQTGAWRTLVADLSGTQAVPPVRSPATGSLRCIADVEQHTVQWEIGYAGLSGRPTAIGLHAPAGPGAVAPAVIVLSPDEEAGNGLRHAGRAPVTPAQLQSLLAGLWYFNLATAAHPGGELRGQIVPGRWPIGGV